jgi:hypothetical protein
LETEASPRSPVASTLVKEAAMAKAQRAKPDHSPDLQRKSVEDIDDVLAKVHHFLCKGSRHPLDDADKINNLVREIRAAHEQRASSRPRQEASQMVKDEPMQGSKAGLADYPALSPELDELLTAVVDNAEIWMSTPSIQFGDRRPSELVGTEEEFKIFDILRAVEQGLF